LPKLGRVDAEQEDTAIPSEETLVEVSAEPAITMTIEAEPVDCTSETRSLACALIVMMVLMLVQAVSVSLAVAFGFLEIDWKQFGLGSLFLVVAELVRRALAAYLRTVYLRRVVGLSVEQTRDIEGPRLDLRRDWLSDLLASPRTKCRIKVCDVLFRKGGHVFTLTFTLFFTGWFSDHGAVVFSLSLGALLLVCAQAAAIWFCRSPSARPWWRVLYLIFGASDRIRDGRFGMRNAMGGSVSMMWGVLFAYLIALGGMPHSDDVPGLWDLITSLVMMPLSYGDAMGEIIGTPFGGRWLWKFKVRGFGEINQKSIEGCIAVFLGSLVPGLIAVGTSGESVAPATWALPVALAALTTLTETFSFRSTDNFVIPVCNAAFVVCWWHLSHAGGIMKGE